MGDLISRSALIEELRNATCTDEYGEFLLKKFAVGIVRKQQTAYNVEKVIEQTHKIFVDELDLVLKPLPDGSEYPEEAYRLLYLNKCVSDAIRNGGKE